MIETTPEMRGKLKKSNPRIVRISEMSCTELRPATRTCAEGVLMLLYMSP